MKDFLWKVFGMFIGILISNWILDAAGCHQPKHGPYLNWYKLDAGTP